MTDGEFGYLIAFGFVLMGGIVIAIPGRMLEVLHRYHDGKIWTKNKPYQWLVQPSVYIPGVRALGSFWVFLGLLLLIGLLLTRSQR